MRIRLIALAAVLASALACPAPIPELSTDDSQRPVPAIARIEPSQGFAATDDGFEGTQVSVDLENFPSEGSLELYFAEAQAEQVQRSGDSLTARVPAGAFTGPVTALLYPADGGLPIEASSEAPFIVYGPPQLFAVEPGLAYAPMPSPPPDICPMEDPSRPLQLPRPAGCNPDDEGGKGTLITLRGDRLGEEGQPDLTTVTLRRSAAVGEERVEALLGSVTGEEIQLCLPERTDADQTLWRTEESSWDIEVATPAGRTELGQERPVWFPGCPLITSIDPPGGFAQGVATIFGAGFPPRRELLSVALYPQDDPLAEPIEIKILDPTPSRIEVQLAPIAEGATLAEPGKTRVFDVVVATPAGRAAHLLPFAVTGAPLVEALSPSQGFATDNWSVLIEGEGFDISNTAANVVTLHRMGQETPSAPVNARVLAVSPVSLEFAIPTELDTAPGLYDVSVTTTAGSSPPECHPNASGGEQEFAGPSCLEIFGPPQIEELFPARAVWGDLIGVIGGPFDTRNPITANAALGAGPGLDFKVVDAELDRLLLQVTRPTSCEPDAGVADAGACEDEGPNLPREMWPQITITTASGVSNAIELAVVDDEDILTHGGLGGDIVIGNNPLPWPTTAAATRTPLYVWGRPGANKLHYWFTPQVRGRVQLDLPFDHSAFAPTPYSKRLYIFSGDGGIWLSESQRTAEGQLGFFPPRPSGTPAPEADGGQVVAAAAGRSFAESGIDRMVYVTEHTATMNPECSVERRVHFGRVGDGAGANSDWCTLAGYYAKSVHVVEDEEGFERVLAELDLSQGCTKYVQNELFLPELDAGYGGPGDVEPEPLDPGSGFQLLEWACSQPPGPGRSCTALVQLDCVDRNEASSIDGGTLVFREAQVTPLINGITLSDSGFIHPAPVGRTALVVHRTDPQNGLEELGKLVDYHEPVRCEQVLTECSDSEAEVRFVPPTLALELGQLSALGPSDIDTVLGVGVDLEGMAQLIRAERSAAPVRWPIVTQVHGPMAVNGYGAMAFYEGAGTGELHGAHLRRPLANRLRRFAIDQFNVETKLSVRPGSQHMVEPHCGAFNKPCAVFTGRAYCIDESAYCSDTLWNLLGDDRALCVDVLEPGSHKPLRTLMKILPLPAIDPPVRGLTVWGERVCVVAEPSSGSGESKLYCVPAAVACQLTSQPDLDLGLGGRFAEPRFAALPGGALLITDVGNPRIAVVHPNNSVDSYQLPLPAGITSVLVRRDRDEVIVATPGALWRVLPAGDSVEVEQIFVDEQLPAVPLTLVSPWPEDAVFVYAAETPDPLGPRVLLTLDLDAQRVASQVISVERHTGAIIARHGVKELLIGRAAPPGISSLNREEPGLRSFAAVPSAPAQVGIESISSSLDGAHLLAVDSAGELYFIY